MSRTTAVRRRSSAFTTPPGSRPDPTASRWFSTASPWTSERSRSSEPCLGSGLDRLSLLAEQPCQADAEDLEEDHRSPHRKHPDPAATRRQYRRRNRDQQDREL